MAVTVLDEVEPLLLLERGLQVLGTAQQARLAFLADAPFEDGFDEHRAVALDERLDLLFARIRSQHLGRRKADELQHPGAIQHACDLHVCALLDSLVGFAPSAYYFRRADGRDDKKVVGSTILSSCLMSRSKSRRKKAVTSPDLTLVSVSQALLGGAHLSFRRVDTVLGVRQ